MNGAFIKVVIEFTMRLTGAVEGFVEFLDRGRTHAVLKSSYLSNIDIMLHGPVQKSGLDVKRLHFQVIRRRKRV